MPKDKIPALSVVIPAYNEKEADLGGAAGASCCGRRGVGKRRRVRKRASGSASAAFLEENPAGSRLQLIHFFLSLSASLRFHFCPMGAVLGHRPLAGQKRTDFLASGRALALPGSHLYLLWRACLAVQAEFCPSFPFIVWPGDEIPFGIFSHPADPMGIRGMAGA